MPQNDMQKIQDFQNYLLVERNLSQNSIRSYSYDLSKFQSYVKKNQIQFEQVNQKTLQNFIVDQKKNKNISARSQARIIASLRHFYRF